jgi:hypothetical protein
MFAQIKQEEPLYNEFTHLSEHALSFLKALLVKDESRRLGYSGSDSVRNHAFFTSIDWDKLTAAQLVPPIRPAIHRKVVAPSIPVCRRVASVGQYVAELDHSHPLSRPLTHEHSVKHSINRSPQTLWPLQSAVRCLQTFRWLLNPRHHHDRECHDAMIMHTIMYFVQRHTTISCIAQLYSSPSKQRVRVSERTTCPHHVPHCLHFLFQPSSSNDDTMARWVRSVLQAVVITLVTIALVMVYRASHFESLQPRVASVNFPAFHRSTVYHISTHRASERERE